MRCVPTTNMPDLCATMVSAGEAEGLPYRLELSEAPESPIFLGSAAADVLLALKHHAEHTGNKVWGDRYALLRAYQVVFNRTITKASLDAALEELILALRRAGYGPDRLLARNRRTGQYRLLRTLHVRREGVA